MTNSGDNPKEYMSNSTDNKVVSTMLEAGCHFGHRASKWNPKMRKFLYDRRDGIHVFDLTKSATYLEKALEFLRESCAAGKSVLLVSTKLQAIKLITEAANETDSAFVTRKWIPGLLTNFDTVKRRIKYFKDLKEQKAKGEWEEKYTKKERVELGRTLEKLQTAFSGVEHMYRVPDVIVVLDAVRDTLALKEARRLNIPTVAVCDSNADPDLVTYVVPGNDDAVKALSFFVSEFKKAIGEGKRRAGNIKKAEVKDKEEMPVAKS